MNVPESKTALATTAEHLPSPYGSGMETASAAVAAQAKALVEARYVIAMRRPRNLDQVRQDLLKECRRPAFAHNKSAFYRKPIGDGVEGLGIRFVEVALRCMTNVLVESTMIFEDETKEIHRVTVTDLEANLTWPLDIKVSKTVERSKPSDDGTYISSRKNSGGRIVYTVVANDDDLLNKRAALISKGIRTLGLRIIPGDLQDEAEEIIKKIRLDRAAEDPNAERKRIIDAFGELNVTAQMLTDYLGHDIGASSPSELVNLRALYGAIKDGEATWATAMENKAEQGNGKSSDGAGAKAFYPDQLFEKHLPGWLKLIEGKKKTPADVIAVAESKFPLTDAQKARITGKPADAPQFTFEQIKAQMEAATNIDDLDAAGSLISQLTDEAHRAELGEIYSTRFNAVTQE